MAATVKVVSHAEGEAIAQVAFDGQVRLLRVGVNEVLGLRIAEGLERQRERKWRIRRRRIGQVVLIEEQGIRLVQSLELLLLRLIVELAHGHAIRVRKNPSENTGGI